MRRLLLVCVAITLAPGFAGAAEGAASSIGPMLAEGQRLFQRASNTEEEEQARELYRRALHRFEYAVEEGEIYNGRLFYNIANAYYRIGDLGRSVLYYRRAALLRPADPNVRHNLEQARQRRADRLPNSQEASVARVLFFWHYLVPPQTRAYVFVATFAAAWILAGVYLLQKQRRLLTAAIVSGVCAALFFGSLMVHAAELRRSDEGVITATEVTARKGDGIAYQSSFVDPLHAGTEFRILERRADWYRIELTDGRTTWIPADAAALIGPIGTP
jgi:hypothetical protein